MANSDTRLHGSGASIFVDGTKVVAKAQWTLNRNRDTVEVTSFGDTNKHYVVGLPDISGSFAGFLDASGDLLLTAAGTSTPHGLALWALDSTTEVAHGSGFIDATVTAGVSDAIRITGNFRASNNWTIDL